MTAYLTSSTGDAMAALLPGLASYKALPSSEAKDAVLLLASLRVDNSRRWQGRRYDVAQVLEFPRVPYGSPSTVVWDWDTGTDAAVVPECVKMAVLFEADSIADAAADEIRKKIASGIASESTGSSSRSFRDIAAARALSPAADDLLDKYRRRTGGVR